jgi:hypothetical protein
VLVLVLVLIPQVVWRHLHVGSWHRDQGILGGLGGLPLVPGLVPAIPFHIDHIGIGIAIGNIDVRKGVRLHVAAAATAL